MEALDFQRATDLLFETITHQDLARELGISLNSIRQARVVPGNKAHRSPPKDWQKGVAALARRQLQHYQHLLDLLAASE